MVFQKHETALLLCLKPRQVFPDSYAPSKKPLLSPSNYFSYSIYFTGSFTRVQAPEGQVSCLFYSSTHYLVSILDLAHSRCPSSWINEWVTSINTGRRMIKLPLTLLQVRLISYTTLGSCQKKSNSPWILYKWNNTLCILFVCKNILRSIHVVACINSLLLLIVEQCSIVRTYNCLFIHALDKQLVVPSFSITIKLDLIIQSLDHVILVYLTF